MTIYARLEALRKSASNNYWGDRITAQLEYANRISKINGRKYDNLIDATIKFIDDNKEQNGVLTECIVLQAERMMDEITCEAKKYKVLCASHSHIDMNFLWGYHETVSVTLNTFRTMLDLLSEYPDFIFSQSQAAAYEIVEKYDPEMLEEIKARVKEGRWEITASAWVEADKNIPDGESMSRHILYTKKYLTDLLDLDPEDLNIDFEPDTFGHSLNVPEVLSNGGVKYYYYCRGHNDKGYNIFNWVSPSGKSVIAYKEPHWYDSRINSDIALTVPEFCEKNSINTMLKVYGVGDHGGGPTRRDLERIRDMSAWPVFPEIKFGRYGDFFKLLEEKKDTLPLVRDELNFIFTGCYTSQSKIKKANRMSESLLEEAEIFNSISSVCASTRYYGEDFARAWKFTLFNQFHDIITGSCIDEVREHAMGRFQDIAAIANSKKSYALSKIATQIDTSMYKLENEDIRESISEGAGAGVGAHLFKIGACERGSGKTRIFHIFNPSIIEREEITEVVLWDWNGNLQNILFKDCNGNKVDYQLIDKGFSEHWSHYFLKVLIKARVPGLGYSTFIMTENDSYDMEDVDLIAHDYPLTLENLPPAEKHEFVLENDYLKVVFDSWNLAIISMINKITNEEFVDAAKPAGVFRLIEEDTFKGGGNAWLVGRYKYIQNLMENVSVKQCYCSSTALRQFITYEIEFGSSKLKVTVSLDADDTKLNYDVECDWHEIGRDNQYTPQLNFYMPVKYKCGTYKYDIPFGTIEREGINQDVPANSWVLGINDKLDGKSVMLVTDSKYGFRSFDNAMALTLIRSSYAPDPYPEIGIHRFSFAICISDANSNKYLIEYAGRYKYPLTVISGKPGKGVLPLSTGFMRLESGTIAISAIKMPEGELQNKEFILRVYETEGRNTTATIYFTNKIVESCFVDINENRIDINADICFEDIKLSFDVAASSMASIYVKFE